jgi:hypothetical protein
MLELLEGGLDQWGVSDLAIALFFHLKCVEGSKSLSCVRSKK